MESEGEYSVMMIGPHCQWEKKFDNTRKIGDIQAQGVINIYNRKLENAKTFTYLSNDGKQIKLGSNELPYDTKLSDSMIGKEAIFTASDRSMSAAFMIWASKNNYIVRDAELHVAGAHQISSMLQSGDSAPSDDEIPPAVRRLFTHMMAARTALTPLMAGIGVEVFIEEVDDQLPELTPVNVVIKQSDLDHIVVKKFEDIDIENGTCAICKEDFEATDEVRQLPCKHLFHKTCIDQWLTKHSNTCPLCKVKIGRGQPLIDDELESTDV